MKEERKIPRKNYFILAIIIIITIELTLYINVWIKTYKTNLFSVSPLKDQISEININELAEVINETSERVLYVGYNNKEAIYNMEKKLLNTIKKNEMIEECIYLNVTDYLDNNEYISIIKSELVDNQNEIIKAPMLIYIKDGKIVKIINSTNDLIDSKSFSSLIDNYEMK